MIPRLTTFLSDDNGQDLIEYTLLMAFVVFTVAGLIIGIGSSIAGITNTSTSQINAANASIS
jgi:Flp pilus assembly pilin Flp